MDQRLIVMGVAVAMACSSGVHAETYRDAVRGWSIDLPPGWVAASPEAVKTMDEQIGAAFKQSKGFTFIASFSKSKSWAPNAPYVIMQFTPIDFSNASREDVEKAFQALATTDIGRQASAATTGPVSDLLKDAKVGSAILDPMNRVLVTFDLPGPPALKGQQVGLIAKDGMIQMNWYDLAEKPLATPAEFDAMAASFRLDPDRAWTPATGGGGVMSGAVRGAIIGACVGLVLMVIRKFRSKGA